MRGWTEGGGSHEEDVTGWPFGALLPERPRSSSDAPVSSQGQTLVTSLRLLLLAGTALTASSGAAFAQTAPATPPQTPPAQQQPAPEAEDETEVEEVVVEGRTSDVRTSIDSVSYSLANDLQASTGSLADALRNVPSVDVDPQGNVSLRGDSNVTILVDGRPSGMLSGEGRAQAIQQLRADQYSRIEVMTNPSAAYSPEGSGGVINLITRPNQPRPGQTSTASIRANVGDNGRWNLGASGSQTRGALTVTGDVGYRYDTPEQVIERVRETLDAGSGQYLPSRHHQVFDIESKGGFGRLGLEYALGARDHLSFEVRGSDFSTDADNFETQEGENAAGAVVGAYTRDARAVQAFTGYGLTGRLLHKFDDAGHEWTNELRLDKGQNSLDILTAVDVILPDAPVSYEQVANSGDFTILALTSAYVRPMGEARLRLGYELETRQPEQQNRVRRGPTEDALTPVSALSYQFEAEQTVHALYATYERPLTEKLSAQAGLRLEQADIELNHVSSGTRASQDYFRAYPTAHLSYALNDQQTLRASYSRRIQRPQPIQLNPFVTYIDPLNLRSGNPDLEPQETDAFEAMWQMRAGQTFYQATAYYRDTRKAFTDVATDIGGGVLLTRPENLGARTDMGVELVANGRLHSTLRYNASVNAFQQEIDAAGLPGATNRSATQVSGRLTLNWQPTADDFLQINGQWNGEQLLAQGVRDAGRLVNLGYRRKLTEAVAFQLTVRDLFDEFGDVVTYDTPQFRERTQRQFGGRSAYVGLTWTLGTGPRRQQDPQFDFSAPQTGG